MDSKDLILKHAATTVYVDFKQQYTCISGCDMSGCNVTYPDYQYRLLVKQGSKACS
jgi:hypothetical protein